jgi:YD repeat-containing protein
MKKLSETYKELGIAFTFPIKIKDEKGKETYYENSDGNWYRYEYNENGKVTYNETSNGNWYRREYDENGKVTYYEDSDDSDDFWSRREYDEDGNETYYENSVGIKRGTKRNSCDGKVIEVDGKKYKLMEL